MTTKLSWTPEAAKKIAEQTGGRPSRPRAIQLGSVADVRLMEVPAAAECRPGLRPTEYNVVVAPAVMPERAGSIFLPDEAQERMGLALQIGRLVAVSPIAFNYDDDWPDLGKPEVGNVVWFSRFAGGEFTGADGRVYRLIKDKDIGAVIETVALERE